MSLTNIKSLPIEITDLKYLKVLDITHCINLKNDAVIKKLQINGVKVVL